LPPNIARTDLDPRHSRDTQGADIDKHHFLMSWQPQDEPLRQLAQYLSDSLSFTDKHAQKNAEIVSTQIHTTHVDAKQS
jgi:hypothetical protein